MNGRMEVNGRIRIGGQSPVVVKEGRLSFADEPRAARTEQEWARSRPSNVQHGQKRPRPMTPAQAFWISLGLILVGGVIVYLAVSALG